MRKRVFAAALAGAGLGLAVQPVLAHDIEIKLLYGRPAIVMTATYGETDPVSYASARVYAPGKPDVEYQVGHADAAGRFAFVPDREGAWQAVVDDELGHRKRIVIPISRGFIATGAASGPGAPAPRLPLWQRALAGIALIFGAAGFWYGFKARRGIGI